MDKKRYAKLEEWCEGVAQIVVDALIEAKLIDPLQFDKAAEIVTEEITMRLTIGDYPPPEIHDSESAA